MTKKTEAPGFFIKNEWGKLFEKLTNEEVGGILKNMFRLAEDVELLDMSLAAEMLFISSIAPTQIFNREKYDRKVSANHANGIKGGAPIGNQNAKKQEKTTQNNPKQHKDIDRVKYKDIVKNTDTDKTKDLDIVNINDLDKDINTLKTKDQVKPDVLIENDSILITTNIENEENNFLNNSFNENSLNINSRNNIHKSTSELPPGAMSISEYYRAKGKNS